MFDFTLKHIPGKSHLAADALSRRQLGEGEEIVEDDDLGWIIFPFMWDFQILKYFLPIPSAI